MQDWDWAPFCGGLPLMYSLGCAAFVVKEVFKHLEVDQHFVLL